MNSVRIDVGAGGSACTFYLTDDHGSSELNGPALVDMWARCFGPWEVPFASGEGLTARAIARYALRDHPWDEEVADLVRRFESVTRPSTFAPAASAEAEPQATVALPKASKDQVSLYDYYAGQALVGLLSRKDGVRYGDTHALIARQAAELADAMLAVRASRIGPDVFPPCSD